MTRIAKVAAGNGNNVRQATTRVSRARRRVKRVAFNVTEELDKNVEIYALRKGRLKNEVFVDALRKLLLADQMDPDREPIISLSYR
jgi:hypothetical protein